MIDEEADEFVQVKGADVNVFFSFTELSEILTLFREKIIELDVGFATDLQRSIDLHPAGKITHLHIQ